MSQTTTTDDRQTDATL